jgi:hypothetical protein
MTSVRAQRLTLVQRIGTMEEERERDRAAHALMAEQVKEMYEVFDTAKKVLKAFNWLWVKIAAVLFGVVGTTAAVLTIVEKMSEMLGRH